ncbi:hypothetical protein [Lactiplantibacillus plantarum]|uniref:hypothetical protein n=1 Tax=Lactiplantibacillus plantarum TaxID=1590 RepID=UPI0007B55F73|nr:hypothetical protein [Lactiplantibacillus plantarum]KZU21330.1 Phage protein [Lactiplantibacillus plantarum]KZU27725.1 Phage protein [Lactiplantibacillus plantarum]
MIKFYRKTATIKAEQFDGTKQSADQLGLFKYRGGWYLETLEGSMLVSNGYWIATGVNGEHWAIADDVFKQTYAELPVIPRVWVDTIERFKANHYRLDEIFTEWDWNYDEQELIARAWLDGYVVEEEHD